jgi:hypothetical protein
MPGTLCRVLTRDTRVRFCQRHSIDEKQRQISDDEIRDYFGTLFAAVSGAKFVFNMDELSHRTWADAHKTVCFVRAELSITGHWGPKSALR